MPVIAPFRGVLYNPEKVDVAKVLAPPYDVIDAAARSQLVGADPHNVVRLIVPEADKGEGGADKYAVAARTFAEWQTSGVLVRDMYKAVYRYAQHFTAPEIGPKHFVRRGLVCAVRLSAPSEGRILPHERTLAKPKEDRLSLMKATRAHFSQVFGLYSDAVAEAERVLKPFESRKPTIDATTPDGVRHVVWRISDAEAIGKVKRILGPKKLILADGHHRYETMLALREHFAAAAGKAGLGQYSAAQYATMFLCATDDDGLVVLPTHRILHSLDGFDKKVLLERAREYFMVEPVPGGAKDGAAVRAALETTPGHQPAIVAVFPGEADGWRLTLDPHVNPLNCGLTGSLSVLKLDVSLLHGLVFERILGITPAAQEAQANLRYVKDTTATLAEIGAGKGQAAFLLSPMSVDAVRSVAESGDVMPQKSTFFHPKLASGLVFNSIDPDEDLQ